jgi:hypothetical protein
MAKPPYIETIHEAAYRRGCHQTAFNIREMIRSATTLEDVKALADQWVRVLSRMRDARKELHGYLWMACAEISEKRKRSRVVPKPTPRPETDHVDEPPSHEY